MDNQRGCATMEFRVRDYDAEVRARSLPRIPADSHPLASATPGLVQVDALSPGKKDIFDPLRSSCGDPFVPAEELPQAFSYSKKDMSHGVSLQNLTKEWITFKKFLLQKFPGTQLVSVSPISSKVIRSKKEYENLATTPLDELADSQVVTAEEGIMVIPQQEYVEKLSVVKSQIRHSWSSGDLVTSLRLSIKVARLLMDTAVLQFYPKLFSLATDILDMLGDVVWERIKHKAVSSQDGSQIHILAEDFRASDICSEAKETCHNWFCKIGSIRELLPRIYLELAILPCWRFLHDCPDQVVDRLVLMIRGLADPLASAYCQLYMIHCVQKLRSHDREYLIKCIHEINLRMSPLASPKGNLDEKISKSNLMVISLIEPTIEFMIKAVFHEPKQVSSSLQASCVLMELGLQNSQLEISKGPSYVSLILYHLLKALPSESVSSSPLDILKLIECSNDFSFDQCNNLRLLGFRLCEQSHSTDVTTAVMDKIIKVTSQYNSLDDYLKVVDAYADIFLQGPMKKYLQEIFDGITKRACSKWISDGEMDGLSSILVKILTHLTCVEDALQLNNFTELLDVLRGRAKRTVNAIMLRMATRNANVHDPTTARFLFEVAQGLYGGKDSTSMTHDDDLQLRQLLLRFVQLVDYGEDVERNLAFLVDCRGAFADVDQLKETLVHISNRLAIAAVKGGMQQFSLMRSCLAFCEVTIPSVPSHMKQLNLYLETTEVALMCGLVCHADELIDSAMVCVESLGLDNGSQQPIDIDGLLSGIGKLCSLLVLVPDDAAHGVTRIPKKLLSLVLPQLWKTTRCKIKILSGVILLLAALSQKKLLYHVNCKEVFGNDILYNGDLSYQQELMSLLSSVLQIMVDTIQEEESQATRGILALEACNSIASSLKMNDEVLGICTKLMEMAKLCLGADARYLISTGRFLDRQIHTRQKMG